MEATYNNGGCLVEALNAKVLGNGTDTIVLAHGFGLDQKVWRFLIPSLACYFKVVVFDLIFSPNVNPNLYDPNKYSNFSGYAKDLINLLDELNIDKAIYLGHSMSAMIGCTTALERPHLFQHLILLDGSPRYLDTAKYQGGFNHSQIEDLLHKMKENFSGWVPKFAPIAVGADDTEAKNIFKDSLGRMNPETAHSVAKMVFFSDVRKILPQVSVPCTIIQPKHDVIVPQFVALYMKRKIGSLATVEILDTEGHFPQLTACPLLEKTLMKVL